MQADRMTYAKRRYSAACAAVLRGDRDAERLCNEALAELKAAKAAKETTQRSANGAANDA